jgi:hypothetical protein
MLLVQTLICSGQLSHEAGHKKQVPSVTVSWSATLSLGSGGSPSVQAGNVVRSLRKSMQYCRHWFIKYTEFYIWAFFSVWYCNLYNQGRSVFGVPKWTLQIMVHIHSRWAELWFKRLVYRLSTKWPGICVAQSGNETGFFPQFFYFLLSVQFHQSSILINCSPLWQFASIPSHGLPLRGIAITLRHTILGKTPLDEWSARRRDLYLTTQNTHYRQTSMLLAGFEPKIPAIASPVSTFLFTDFA